MSQTASPLTKPQVAFLAKAMRLGSIYPFGPAYRVAETLLAKGLVEDARARGMEPSVYVPTRAGLEALRAHRNALYGKRGSMASILDLEEVDAALAALPAKQEA